MPGFFSKCFGGGSNTTTQISNIRNSVGAMITEQRKSENKKKLTIFCAECPGKESVSAIKKLLKDIFDLSADANTNAYNGTKHANIDSLAELLLDMPVNQFADNGFREAFAELLGVLKGSSRLGSQNGYEETQKFIKAYRQSRAVEVSQTNDDSGSADKPVYLIGL